MLLVLLLAEGRLLLLNMLVNWLFRAMPPLNWSFAFALGLWGIAASDDIQRGYMAAYHTWRYIIRRGGRSRSWRSISSHGWESASKIRQFHQAASVWYQLLSC